MSEKKKVAEELSAVRIWVKKTITKQGHADVLVPSRFIHKHAEPKPAVLQALRYTLLDNAECIDWYDDGEDVDDDLDIESVDPLMSCDDEAVATLVLYEDKDGEWQCLSASLIVNTAEVEEDED
jgi:hypothetical protein